MRTLFSAACGTKSSEFSETLRSADSVPLWLDWSVSGLVRVAVHVKRKSYMKSYETHKFSVLLSVRQAYLGNDLWAAASEMEALRCRI